MLKAINIILLFLMCIGIAPCGTQQAAGRNPINYGWVSYAMLSDLAPEQLQSSCNLLFQHHLNQASAGFKTELSKYPNALVAFVGLVQSTPSVWPSLISQLEKNSAAGKTDAETDFELGTLLYYQWGQQSTNNTGIARAQTLLDKAWQQDHAPIIGMMLADTLGIGKYSHYPPLKAVGDRSITEQLISKLAGPRAFSFYQSAKSSGWQMEPPPLDWVQPKNVRPLIGMVRNLRSLSSSRVGTTEVVNGNYVAVTSPYTPTQTAEQNYLAAWFRVLLPGLWQPPKH
jgi:hypothetical protein